MTSGVTANTASGACPRPAWWPHSICTNLTLKPCACGRQRISGNFLIDMDRLSMLAEIIESGKPARAVALEGTFAGVFSNMASQMFAPCET
jgi:hypothetical protein